MVMILTGSVFRPLNLPYVCSTCFRTFRHFLQEFDDLIGAAGAVSEDRHEIHPEGIVGIELLLSREPVVEGVHHGLDIARQICGALQNGTLI